MKNRLGRGVGLALLVALIPAIVVAQREPPKVPRDVKACRGNGALCLFGKAYWCRIYCVTGTPVCEDARCFLGFPIASKCCCDGVAT